MRKKSKTVLFILLFLLTGAVNTLCLYAQDITLEVLSMDEEVVEPNILQPHIIVKNVGTVSVADFQLYYYVTIPEGKELVCADHYTPNSEVTFEDLGDNDWRIVYDFTGYTLSPGQVTPSNAGNVIGVHFSDWSVFDKSDDYSDNGSAEFVLNDRILIYQGEQLVYGIPPGGPEPSPTPNVAPQPEGSFGAMYEDLIPGDVTLEAYDAESFALITGSVEDSEGQPLEGVSVTAFGHSEYGTAVTGASGDFNLPVEGGVPMTFTYNKEGFIASQRQVNVPLNDTVIVETIRLIAEDTLSTVVAFDGNPGTVVTHVSSVITDESGSRACTMVFKGDNAAYEVDAEGNIVRELSTITTRSTEFTTPETMPASLPPTSAFTYCAELAVDGAERVVFDKPVISYVDNFLGFEVGTIVPSGYYDRDRAVWVPSDNGVVVELLDTDSDGVVDAQDADGDTLPDDLNGDGSFADEVTGLADSSIYTPGSTYWRVEVSHFTPWDYNWSFGPPADAIAPNPAAEPVTLDEQPIENDCSGTSGSTPPEYGGVYHDHIAIPGTDDSLHYTSNRAPGFETQILVPASGASVPASLKEIIVKVEIAGRTLEQVLPALPNRQAEFLWDGTDHLGQDVEMTTTAHVSIGFVYDMVYTTVSAELAWAFGQAGTFISTIPGRQELVIWKYNKLDVYSEKSRSNDVIAEGWSVSSHHYFNPAAPNTLHKGDGSVLTDTTQIITTIAGTGEHGFSGDGGPAVEAMLYQPRMAVSDLEGNIYIADPFNDQIRKIDAGGIITTIAGNGSAGYSGDGGLAIEAGFREIFSMTIDDEGNLYVGDDCRIRKIDTSGIITTIAGTGIEGYSGDGGPATEATFWRTMCMTVDNAGNLYFYDYWNRRLRKIDTNGIISTIGGNGLNGFSGDDGLAIDASFNGPEGMAVDASGNLYIADTWNNRIRKIDTSGIITTVAGKDDYGYSGDDGLATDARLNRPFGVAVDSIGNIYISDTNNHRIRKVDTSDIITTIAGLGDDGIGYHRGGYGGDGGPAGEAYLRYPRGLYIDAEENLVIADTDNYAVRKVSRVTSADSGLDAYMNPGETGLAESCSLGHIFSAEGLHQRTVDLASGDILRSFGYDSDDNLISITDQNGDTTYITRDSAGKPVSMTSPSGLATTLVIDDNNHLTMAVMPDSNFHSFGYTPDGLMTLHHEDPAGNHVVNSYDTLGRLDN